MHWNPRDEKRHRNEKQDQVRSPSFHLRTTILVFSDCESGNPEFVVDSAVDDTDDREGNEELDDEAERGINLTILFCWPLLK